MQVKIGIAAGVSVVLYWASEAVMTYVFEAHAFSIVKLFIWSLGNVILCVYWAMDLRFMVTKRRYKYRTSESYNAFWDLHTDIFFFFWYDLIKKEEYSIDVEQAMKNDKQTPIHINVEEAKHPLD